MGEDSEKMRRNEKIKKVEDHEHEDAFPCEFVNVCMCVWGALIKLYVTQHY